jgi:SAM-dependent methyltransferase
LKSKDGGATWSSPIKLVANYSFSGTSYTFTAGSVTDIKIDPANSQIVIVTTNKGLFRSTDAGTTYQHVPLVGAASADIYYWMWSAAYAGPHTWLVTGERLDITGKTTGGGMGLWRSADDGATWTWNGTALPGGNADAAAAGRGTLSAALSTVQDVSSSRIYLLAGNKGSSGALSGDATRDVYRSDDGGKTFISLGVNASGRPSNSNPDQTDLNVLHAQAWYNQALLVDPGNPDTVFVGGDLAMIHSTNGGQSWSVLSDWLPAATLVKRPYVHADFHAFAMGIDGTFYAGTDGGIFLSSNARSGDVASVTFTSARNEGLVTHLIYNVACAPETWPADMQGWMAGGMQDNGTRVRKSSPTTAWTTTFDQLLGGDGIGCAVSAGAANGLPGTFLASTEGAVYRSFDGGHSWTKFTGGMANPPPFFVRIARDEMALEPDAFLTFSFPAAMYRSAAGSDWTDISGALHWSSPSQGGPAVTNGFTTPTGGSIGLRNVTDIDRALAEARRVLKPGGRFLCLEFSQVVLPMLR